MHEFVHLTLVKYLHINAGASVFTCKYRFYVKYNDALDRTVAFTEQTFSD